MELTEEAKRLIKDEFDELAKQQNSCLTELTLYRWLLRAIFLVLFGGSIIGILKFQDYLDSRITERTGQFESVYAGLILLSTSDAAGAVKEFDRVLPDIETTLFKPSERFRQYYFAAFIRALAESNEQDVDGSFTGKPVWDRLNANATFRRDYSQNITQWRANHHFLNSWAHCALKYDDNPAAMGKAKGYFEKALTLNDQPGVKAANIYGLALIDVLEGDCESAAARLKAREQLNPKKFSNGEFTGNPQIDLPDECALWSAAARRLTKRSFDDNYAQTILLLKK